MHDSPYDETYRCLAAAFGTEPDSLLVEYREQLSAPRPLLDIGAGQGRNSLWLARHGFEVVALEPSSVGAAAVSSAAATANLSLQVVNDTFEDHEGVPGGYGAVFAFGLVPDLDREQVGRRCAMMTAQVARGGLLMLTGFTTEDPAYERHRRAWIEIGKGSFAAPDGIDAPPGSPGMRVRTYLDPGEIRELFPGCRTIHHEEKLGPEHRHGDGPLERHGRFEYVARRP